jgi:glyoxylase-like metal-dependent hydrolase (beta-lactamase superfamily II)
LALIHILCEGYVRETEDELRVGSTVAYVEDGDVRVVIDPGMVAGRESILAPLASIGRSAADVTDVVLSHHHPDHTINVALFPGARVHDFAAVYEGDLWIDRQADGFQISPNVSLIHTPGHTSEDITTLVRTDEGLVAFTHLWWAADGPAEDPYAPDREQLRANRERVLALASIVVPGHGASFVPSEETPR